MGFLLFQLNLKDMVWRGISVSIGAAVILVFLGPAFDHHFVERQHNHSHIYLNVSAAEHHHHEAHPFEEPHSHSDIGTDRNGHHGVIYQASNDLIGESGTSFIMALIDNSNPLIHEDGSSARTRMTNESELTETFITPPKRPPRN